MTRRTAAVSLSALFAGSLLISPVIASGEEAVPSSETTDPSTLPVDPDSADATEGGNLDECDIQGTPNRDELESNDNGQVVCGMGGNDTISGFGGDDELRGGPGKDELMGGGGNDDMLGGTGEDNCRQGDGHGRLESCEWPSPIETCPYPKGTVYNDFGAPRAGHKHQGNDIIAPGNRKGDPVYATMNGNAEKDTASGAGFYVIVRGARGFTYNMHMLRRGRATGKVQAGDRIGFVGSTGNAGSTNHVHFEWHWEGQGNDWWDWPASDPFPYLKKVCERTANSPIGPESESLATASDQIDPPA